MKLPLKIIASGLLMGALGLACQPEAQQTNTAPPNIVYILADDLGYGDLSILGQEKFQTPHIDRLAKQGMIFTQHYSGSTVCAPSRSALMTGQHTGHTPVRGNQEVLPEGQHPLPAASFTLAEMLREQGYATGIFGKWGLGYPGSEGDPLNQGFDRFYGYNCQRIGHNYYPMWMWDNDQRVELAENQGSEEGAYGPTLIHEQTLQFIEDNKEQPFFAYVASIIPHAELKIPAQYMEALEGKLEPETPFEGCDPGCERYKIGGYGSQERPHAAFAAMVQLLDQQVGEIVAKLDELGLSENTLIIFSSDNGPHLEGGADPNYFNSNGVFRGYKRDLFEGGIRVPTIANWPGVIQAGTTSDHISAFWDVMPTLAELSGANIEALPIDGISFLPTLKGEAQSAHSHLYWEFHEKNSRRAVRQGDWKLVQMDLKNEQPTTYLFNLKDDPAEENNLAAAQPEKVESLKALMQERTVAELEKWNF